MHLTLGVIKWVKMYNAPTGECTVGKLTVGKIPNGNTSPLGKNTPQTLDLSRFSQWAVKLSVTLHNVLQKTGFFGVCLRPLRVQLFSHFDTPMYRQFADYFLKINRLTVHWEN